MKVTALSYRWPHHARHSGYDLLVGALAELADVDAVDPEAGRPLPPPVFQRLAERSGMKYYGPRAAAFEVAAVKRLWLRRAEICHFLYGEDSFRYAAALTPGRRGAIVCTYHSPRWWLDELVQDLRPLASLDAVVVVASHQIGQLSDVVARDRLFFIPHGIDTSFFKPADERRPPGRRAIFVGEHLRDFELLERVARELWTRDSDITIEAITSPDHIDELNALPNVIARSGIHDHALLDAYRRADLLVLPLRDATANNTLLEGLGCGLPVVVTDVGGVRDYASEEAASFVPAGDVRAMAGAVADLMTNDARRRVMAIASRRRATLFDWDTVAGTHVELYRELLRRRAWSARARRVGRPMRPGGGLASPRTS